MKDFCEAILMIEVRSDLASVYKKAIETENSPAMLVTHWNGVHASVTYFADEMKTADTQLTIQLLSHTVDSIRQVVDWYERVGCTVIYKNYREESK